MNAIAGTTESSGASYDQIEPLSKGTHSHSTSRSHGRSLHKRSQRKLPEKFEPEGCCWADETKGSYPSWLLEGIAPEWTGSCIQSAWREKRGECTERRRGSQTGRLERLRSETARRRTLYLPLSHPTQLEVIAFFLSQSKASQAVGSLEHTETIIQSNSSSHRLALALSQLTR